MKRNRLACVFTFPLVVVLLMGTAYSQPRIVKKIPISPSILPNIGWGIEHDGKHLWVPTVAPDSQVYRIDPGDGIHLVEGAYVHHTR